MSDDNGDAFNLGEVHLGVPTHSGTVNLHTYMCGLQLVEPGLKVIGSPRVTGKMDSLLARNFTQLLLLAFCNNTKWFVMMHADISAEAGWLTKLVRLAMKHETDLLSVVIPFKNETGCTSTGLDFEHGDGTGFVDKFRRLTMKEIVRLPETFNREDVATELSIKDPGALIVNTGLMVMRLGTWVFDWDGFHIREKLTWTKEWSEERKAYRMHGHVSCAPEDWNLSRFMHDKGMKVMCTRAVDAEHHGMISFGNQEAWGTWETDAGEHCGIEANVETEEVEQDATSST